MIDEHELDATATLRVVVAEPHPICRVAITRLISTAPQMRLAGETGSLAEAPALARDEKADLVLLTVERISDCHFIEQILTEAPGTAVVVLATEAIGELTVGALRAGAGGLVMKGADPDEVIEALRRVGGGETVIDTSVTVPALTWAAAARNGNDDKRWKSLTEREREILDLLASGVRPRDIATRLYLSRRTVEWYLCGTYRKLGVRGRIDAVREFYRLPQVSGDDYGPPSRSA